MDLNWLLPLAIFSFITCATPGPNNMLLTAVGATHGFRRTLPLLMSVVSGITVLILMMTLGLGVIFERFPLLHDLMRVSGSLYLCWLSWKISRSGMPSDTASATVHPYQGLLLQLINPKAWIMAVTAVSLFTLPNEAYWLSAGWILATFFITGLYTGAFWILCGAQARHMIQTAKGWRRFNLTMGAATLACIVILWL